MGQVQALILSGDEVGDLQEVIRTARLQTIASEHLLDVMLKMFASRAEAPLRLLVLDGDNFVFTSRWNYCNSLGYAGPEVWVSKADWIYVIRRDPSDDGAFSMLADMAFAWSNSFPEMYSSELAALLRR